MDRDLLYGVPAELIAQAARVSLHTAHRYKRLGRLTPAARALLELVVHGELAVLAPAWQGFTLRGDRLWTPYGFGVLPNEISALAYRFAQVRALESELAEPQQWALFGSPDTYSGG